MDNANPVNTEVTSKIIVDEIPKSINISNEDVDYAFNMDYSEFIENFMYLTQSDKELFKSIINILQANLISENIQVYCRSLLVFVSF